jgi:Na+-driven multidrug efflux pump
MNSIKNSLTRINYRLFTALLLFGLVPTIYTTFRIYLIGQLPGDWGFSIASQLQWVNLLYEILQEALILPLFFFIGAVLTNKDELINRIKTGLAFTFVVYMVLSLLIFTFARPLVVFMAQDQTLINETVSYIRLETIAMVFMTLVKFLMVVLVTIKKDRNVYAVMGVQLILTVIFDVFFVSTLSFSMNLGVNGIAITNIVVNALLLGVSIVLLYKNDLSLFYKNKMDYTWLKDLFKKGGISGLESFVRNLAFMLMIVRMVNVVGEQGTFWVANNFIWGWLLLPVIQLGELIKADCGEESYTAVKTKSLGYFSITAVIIAIWGLTLPLWKPFMQHVLQISNYNDVFFIVIISLGFYVLFAFNNVIDSIFYGLGKTNYMLFQSLVINTVFYGTAFILFQFHVFVPNLTLIALLFAMGTALDSLLTMGMYVWLLKRKDISLLDRNKTGLQYEG